MYVFNGLHRYRFSPSSQISRKPATANRGHNLMVECILQVGMALTIPRTSLRRAAFNCDQSKHSQFHKPTTKTTDHIADLELKPPCPF